MLFATLKSSTSWQPTQQHWLVATALSLMCSSVLGQTTNSLTLEVDAAQTTGVIKDVFGVNKKPSFSSRTPGSTVNASNLYTAFGVSQVRLHDAGVDLCAVYLPATKLNVGVTPAQTVTGCELSGTGSPPHFSWTPSSSADADLNNPNNYDFTSVDQTLAEALATGGQIYLRLGESYNGPNDTSDPIAWAKVATNVYKHVIGTFKPTTGIAIDPAYVEVFNEPDGGFWRGSAANFHTLFIETVTRVRAAGAAAGKTIRIGGPGFTRSILTTSTVTGNPANGFVRAVGASNLDFFSAHLYNSCSTATLASAGTFLRSLRSLADNQGATGKPLHITEWNIGLGSQCGNDFFAEQRTQSFASGVLTLMQDPALNVDAAHFYSAVPIMSLFDFTTTSGKARINPSAWAFWAHARLRGATRLSTQVCQGSTCASGLASDALPIMAVATRRASGQTVVVTNDGTTAQDFTLRLKGLTGTQATVTTSQPPAGVVELPASGSPAAISTANMQALAATTSTSIPVALSVSSGVTNTNLTIPARSVMVIDVSTTSPSLAQRADCVFKWGERQFPDLFTPAPFVSFTFDNFLYRFYPGSASYLAVTTTDQHLVYLNTRNNQGLVNLGLLTNWLTTSACS